MDMDARIRAKLVEKMGCTHVPGVEQYMKNIMRKAKANCMGTVGRKGSTSATTKQPKAVPMGRVTKRCSLSSKLGWSSKKAFKGNQYTWFAWEIAMAPQLMVSTTESRRANRVSME